MLPVSTVEKYLSTSSTYTKYKQTRRNFPRLKVLSYHLNKIWSINLADMQSVQSFNNAVRYLLVAVETLSRYLRVEAMKDKYATTKQAFCRMITKRKGFKNSGIVPERLWADAGKEFLGAFAKYCQSKKIKIYQTYNEEKSAFAERNVRSLNSKSLAKTIVLPVSTVEKYLSTSSTYTKYKQTRRNFPRLKVLSYHLNEIWSIDLADMQSVQSFNNGVRYLLVAVETQPLFESRSNEGQIRNNNKTSILSNDYKKKRF